MMLQKAEILARISHLEEISPVEAGDLFSPLRAAVEAFFAPDSTMNHDVSYTIERVGMDYINRNIVFEHKERLPSFNMSFPQGYHKIGDIFDAKGAFVEIMNIEDDPFVDAFYEEAAEGEAGEGEEGGGDPVLLHDGIASWVERIESGKSDALAKMKTLADFCESGSSGFTLANFFEDLGQPTHVPDNKEAARKVYREIGWQEIIDTFGLNVFVPSYLKE